MRPIDADALYERIKAAEELARDRVIDTPNSFPNGAVNPSAIRYMAQLSERTHFREMVFDAPTVDPVKHGKWIERKISDSKNIEGWQSAKCSVCKRYHTIPFTYSFWEDNFCPFCGAKMKEEVEDIPMEYFEAGGK